jgi:hypothetical protein
MNVVFLGVWAWQFATTLSFVLVVMSGALILLSLLARLGAASVDARLADHLEPATAPIPRPQLRLRAESCWAAAAVPSRAPPFHSSPPGGLAIDDLPPDSRRG